MTTKNIYTCSFCGKREQGKDLNHLVPIARYDNKGKLKPLNGTLVSLMPVGWDWDIVPITFEDSWSCGCHKFR